MSAHPQLPPTAAPIETAAAALNQSFPTFGRLLRFAAEPMAGLQRFIRENPSLSLVAVAMISLVLVLKGLTLRATLQDAAIGDWIRANGGGCSASGDSGHLIMSIMSEVFARRVIHGRLISMVTIPVSVANNKDTPLYEQLAKLSRLQNIYITENQNIVAPNLFGAVPVAEAQSKREMVDSCLLQQGLASLPHAVVLSLSQVQLAPCEQPLDLTGRLTAISLQNVHITRDFAQGLPIVRYCTYIMLHNSEIDDDAVDILLERLNSNQIQIYSTSMTASTHARLSAKKGVLVFGQIIVAPKTTAAPNSSVAPAESTTGPSVPVDSSSATGTPSATSSESPVPVNNAPINKPDAGPLSPGSTPP